MKVQEDLLEIRLKDPEDFLKIKETLTRVGVAHKVDDLDVLVQICYILHKRGRYYVTHYKELQRLDGADVEITEADLSKRDTIAGFLVKWGLCESVSRIETDKPAKNIKIVSYRDKDQWLLKTKYRVGRKAD